MTRENQGPAKERWLKPRAGTPWWVGGGVWAWMTLVGVGWGWIRWAETHHARAWVVARPVASRESVFAQAKAHAARFGPEDWNHLVSAALDGDQGLAAWVAWRRAQFPAWLQAWLPVSAGQERWIDLELAWRSCPGKDDALRIMLIQRAAGADATQAWRLTDLAMGEGKPLSLKAIEAVARVADAADFKVRLVVANGLARAAPEARVTARRLLEALQGDGNPEVAETARRVLERPPYR